MKVELTRDVGLVHSVINHPNVFGDLSDGEALPIPIHKNIYYFSARSEIFADGMVEDAILGVVGFHPVNSITWTPHVVALTSGKGHGTEMLAKAMGLMFTLTPCLKLFAAPPEFKMGMIRCFEKCGFHPEGVSRKSFLWRGRVYDRILMGYEKEKQ